MPFDFAVSNVKLEVEFWWYNLRCSASR